MDVTKIHKKILELATEQGFCSESLNAGSPVPITAFTRPVRGPTVYISAGIHGDEPAGTLAILKMLENKSLSIKIDWTLFPILNPWGLDAGTRENQEGIDINRDYKDPKTLEIQAHTQWLAKNKKAYDLAMTLHEDWETSGFYLYAPSPSNHKTAKSIIKAVKSIIPIETASQIDGFKANGGIISPDPKIINLLDQWPEAVYLLHNNPLEHKYTFETPSSLPLEKRVQAQYLAIENAIHMLFP